MDSTKYLNDERRTAFCRKQDYPILRLLQMSPTGFAVCRPCHVTEFVGICTSKKLQRLTRRSILWN